ncbi:hypothetical protein OHB26_16630 [Nocardia sp. NBC_01503]|uniref:hypothetical protein n=1 Tax=Nocardia sp. NBC_01503 TaxID=2975997 RepID=UPI002E7ABC0E|nr:hypothetical protein [Nocardia sp. NBC_01503]WTL35676.1 hypothetical protein OHB26_16630 [Nocardia sp. NBC_01503]
MRTNLLERAPNTSLRQWVTWILGGAAVVLVPWTVLLAATLPNETHVQNWALAWIGLDLLLTGGCFLTALCASRGDERVRIAASATATMAVLDAWFDLTTARPGADFTQAVACAVVELGLAGLCAHLALGRRDG